MLRRSILSLGILVILAGIGATDAFAQGGWDVWTVYLRDGSTQSAAPVWSLDNKVLKRGFMPGGKPDDQGVERSLISHMSNNLGNSEYRRKMGPSYVEPTLPNGPVSRDTVIYDDGRQVVGEVSIRAARDTSGKENIYAPVIVQNGTEVDLTRVAHIRFAAPKTSTSPSKKRTNRR
ncbi:MAG TPA: hypothetical protein VHL50_08900 [Pyrinomonadaceae bacterium]|nr:hypothetical protein [Pyrinomonadaceae bacterium]